MDEAVAPPAIPPTPPKPQEPPPPSAYEARNLVIDDKAMTLGFDLVIYKGRDADADLAALDPAGQPIEEKVVGPWLFRIQTAWQHQEAGVEFARLMRGVDPNLAPTYAVLLALARANLPPLLVTGPEGWDWTRTYAKDERTVRGVYSMFTTHTEKF